MVKRQRFTAEFKREAVRLLDAGERPASEVAIDLGIRRDLCSRKVVGWAMSDRNDEPLVPAALRMAITHRQPPAGLIRSGPRDRGSSGTFAG